MNFEARPLDTLTWRQLANYVVDLEREIHRMKRKCYEHKRHIRELQNKLMIERANRGRT